MTTTARPIVYLIAQPTINAAAKLPKLDGLAAFGEVRVVLVEDPRTNPIDALKRIRARLEDFDAALDYVVWVGGETLAAFLMGVVLGSFAEDEEEPFTTINWLRWERGREANGRRTDVGGHYTPIKVSLLAEYNPSSIVPDPHTTDTDDDENS